MECARIDFTPPTLYSQNMKIRYRPNYRKILEALIWVAHERPGKGFHFVLKTLFYADKFHLQQYGRPVLGDVYVKMPYGPVASAAYDILKRSDFVPEEFDAIIEQGLETRPGPHPRVRAKRAPDLSFFSGTDTDCLQAALEHCDRMDFSRLSAETHVERAWLEADMHGEMNYELFIDQDVPDREALLEYIRETSQCLAL